MANDLRQTVKDQLTAKVFTQSELAKSIGMSVGAVSSWLKGTYMGRNDTLGKPPESVKIGFGQFINLCRPPIFSTRSAPGRSIR